MMKLCDLAATHGATLLDHTLMREYEDRRIAMVFCRSAEGVEWLRANLVRSASERLVMPCLLA
mgnify:CR=1 FL=1